MRLKPDEKTAASLADMLLQQRDDDLNAHALTLLLDAGAAYAHTSREHEFAFLDRAMRVCAGIMMQLDAAAARAYLQTLATRVDPQVEPEFRDSAETMRARCYVDLFRALQLVAVEPEGSA